MICIIAMIDSLWHLNAHNEGNLLCGNLVLFCQEIQERTNTVRNNFENLILFPIIIINKFEISHDTLIKIWGSPADLLINQGAKGRTGRHSATPSDSAAPRNRTGNYTLASSPSI